VEDLITRINLSGSEVVARLDVEGKLSLKAVPSYDPQNPDFVLRGMQDSGQFLVGYAGILRQSGAGGAYTWNQANAVTALHTDAQYAVAPLAHPSGWISVNERLAEDPGTIAAASGTAGTSNGIGDGTSALAIAQLQTTPVMVGATSTFDSYFADKVAAIGLKGDEASRSMDTTKLVIKELKDMRESLSGVNQDEELTKMVTYQNAYSAIARFVTTFDQMLQVIINRMAV
jgi:flagellar hook-associated protein 1 FlgK